MSTGCRTIYRQAGSPLRLFRWGRGVSRFPILGVVSWVSVWISIFIAVSFFVTYSCRVGLVPNTTLRSRVLGKPPMPRFPSPLPSDTVLDCILDQNWKVNGVIHVLDELKWKGQDVADCETSFRSVRVSRYIDIRRVNDGRPDVRRFVDSGGEIPAFLSFLLRDHRPTSHQLRRPATHQAALQRDITSHTRHRFCPFRIT